MVPGEVFRVEIPVVQAEGQNVLLALQGRHGVLVLAVGQHGAALGHQVGKGPEGVFHVVQVFEEVQMVGFNVQDDGDGGIEGQEGVAILAGLQNNGLALAHPVAGAQNGQGAANHHGGVDAGGHGNVGTHGGRGRFAVGAGDAQGVFIPPHDRSPSLGPLEDGDARSVGSGDLRVAVVDGSSADDQVLSCHAFGQVANGHGDAQGTQMLHGRAFFHIGAGDDEALPLEHFSQGGHGHTTDAHQMRPLAGHDIVMDSINSHWVYTPFPFRYTI